MGAADGDQDFKADAFRPGGGFGFVDDLRRHSFLFFFVARVLRPLNRIEEVRGGLYRMRPTGAR